MAEENDEVVDGTSGEGADIQEDMTKDAADAENEADKEDSDTE